MDLIDEAVQKARETMRLCSTPNGIYASGGKEGYDMVFARDSMIGLIGTSCYDKEQEFKTQFSTTLNALAKYQSKSGQIPNAIDMFSKRPKQVTFATIDSTLWYLLGLQFYKKNYKGRSLFNRHKKNAKNAFTWLSSQDSGEDFLPEQLPTCDWQDCFPHKYGHTINTMSLYFGALKLFGRKNDMKNVLLASSGKTMSKIEFFDRERGYFRPWVWKNHDGIIEQESWFDSLGNVLAICFDFATKNQTKTILDFIEKNKLDRPFPIRCLYPPIEKNSREWQDYFSKCLASTPHYYLNGGIWPYIGGFYVSALVKAKRFEKAKENLELLAKLNRIGKDYKWEFNEWVHPKSKKALGSSYHAWSAGSFLYALSSLEQKQLPLFP